ncbi:MAG TPA: hypothetical protein VK324_14820 [Tepidisphaeraceae bacterium]|nr:hypothetical protein [Tepidisphaeraceae bacterium]
MAAATNTGSGEAVGSPGHLATGAVAPTVSPARAVRIAHWPSDAKRLLATLDGPGSVPAVLERRRGPRARYNVAATLEPAEPLALKVPPKTLYVRDINRWGAGFIVGLRLNVRSRAVVALAAPGGATLSVRCVVRRCREYAPGWFEGVLDFDAEQPALAAENVWSTGVAGAPTAAVA